ncbi:MAG TPA: LysR family transcriptional regulator [Sphingobium sp.]|nr:LysR family transcriptional regulator [Sphingobium sp.]
MADFDWNCLKSFLAVARCGRLTTAAARLASDHTTLSRRLAKLEDFLGTRLFDRSPEGYALTEQGRQLQRIVEDMERLTDAAVEQVGGASGKIQGVVRIGCPDGFGSYFLADRLHKLTDANPGLNVQLITGPATYSLSKREADIVISVRAPTEGRLVTCKLTDYMLGLYATAPYLNGRSPITTRSDLLSHRFVSYVDDLLNFEELNYRDQIEKNLVPSLESTSVFTQLRATMGGGGVCVLPTFIVHHEPALIPVLPNEIRLTRSFWLILHEDLKNVARVRAVISFIRDEVASAQALFLPVDHVKAGDDRPKARDGSSKITTGIASRKSRDRGSLMN